MTCTQGLRRAGLTWRRPIPRFSPTCASAALRLSAVATAATCSPSTGHSRTGSRSRSCSHRQRAMFSHFTAKRSVRGPARAHPPTRALRPEGDAAQPVAAEPRRTVTQANWPDHNGVQHET